MIIRIFYMVPSIVLRPELWGSVHNSPTRARGSVHCSPTGPLGRKTPVRDSAPSTISWQVLNSWFSLQRIRGLNRGFRTKGGGVLGQEPPILRNLANRDIIVPLWLKDTKNGKNSICKIKIYWDTLKFCPTHISSKYDPNQWKDWCRVYSYQTV